ncbi:MAG: WGR domain-containing protein [Gammaproteobacteria bacterium]|nr:WGR domain-containing protein [Gammaproteobacteria bacterium]
MAYFEKIQPSENMQRFYRISLTPTLFGDWAVVREWGRIGHNGTVREEWFGSLDEAKNEMHALAMMRARRGYEKRP